MTSDYIVKIPKQFLSGDKLLSISIAVLSILSISPIIFSGFNSYLILVFLLLYLSLFVKRMLEKKGGILKTNIAVFLSSFVLAFYLAIPFREFDRLSPSVIWVFVFFSILFLEKDLIRRAFYYFSNITFIICLFALIVLFFYSIKIELPNIIIPRDIGGNYTSYFISARLSGQEYSLFETDLYRLSGIFGEPGHFGLVLTMVLFVYDDILKTSKGKVILITSLLTLSFGTFLLLFILLTKSIIAKRRIFLLLMMTLFVILFASVIPIEILERFFLNKAEGSLEDRTSEAFVVYYDYFQSYGNIFFGGGRDILEANQIRNSDYRGFVIRYGYVGCILLFLMIISLFWRKQWTIQLLGISYFAIVFFHRSWFVDYFLFLFFILILTYYGSDKDNNRGN